MSVLGSDPQCVATSVVGTWHSPTVEDHPTCAGVFRDVTDVAS